MAASSPFLRVDRFCAGVKRLQTLMRDNVFLHLFIYFNLASHENNNDDDKPPYNHFLTLNNIYKERFINLKLSI